MYVDILIELNAKELDKTFTYKVPDNFINSIKVGMRVFVPFGHQKLEGFVLNIHDVKPDYEAREIISLIDDYPVINDEMLELGNYISKKTMSNLITAYQTMLPSALKAHRGFVVNKKYTSYIKIVDRNYVGKNENQKQILNLFEEKDQVLKKDVGMISNSSLNTLIKKGILEEILVETYRMDSDYEIEDNHIILNQEQEYALKSIVDNLNTFKPFLLHGVTGSGKTEVYMHAISEVLKEKKEAIVLVPEISLTPQLVNTFRKRFGSDIAILHSRLNDGEKYDEWRKIERGEVSIVIGARSAIYAPFKNLGLIVIDEEHSTTYKQENNPKYNAIDIALWRAKRYNCPLVLGSATPSIESYTRAKKGIYTLIEMKERVNKNLPKVHLVDMKEELRHNARVYSRLLKQKIEWCLDHDEQAIILLNRRGYSTVVTCKNCGYTDKCPNCDIPLVYHKSTNSMRCHYCEYHKPKLTICPNCKSKDINEYGMGTQKLEELTKELFPKARVVRMDIDTTSKKGSHERIINDFANKKYNILIGTQMIAKGLDFKDVTLVGVLNGDASLNVPDFRSSERTFQLLNQVAGRAGRSEKIGEVVIQGFNIEHYSIIKASIHDYQGFYNEEMRIRKNLKYPPFYNLCLVKIQGKNFDEVSKESEKVGSYLRNNLNDNIFILGPSAPSMSKINKVYYMQIIIKYKNTKDIINTLRFIRTKYQNNKKINIDIDLNPIRL